MSFSAKLAQFDVKSDIPVSYGWKIQTSFDFFFSVQILITAYYLRDYNQTRAGTRANRSVDKRSRVYTQTPMTRLSD